MKRFTMFACLALVLVFAMSAVAGDLPKVHRGVAHSGGTDTAKASRDTFVMIGPWGGAADGSDPPVIGTFEDEFGNSSWNGWTTYDITQPTVTHWQLSDYFADNLPGGAGNMAAWCGTMDYPSCGGEDPDGGYGNSWNDILEFRMAVDNPTSGVTVDFNAYANIDTEPGFDYLNLKYLGEEGPVTVVSYDDFHSNINIVQTFALGVGDYQGENSDEVVIHINFTSDGAWSDEDCSFPSQGAAQVDDVIVTLNQGTPVDYVSDFEDDDWGFWETALPNGVGDFSKLWTNLEDIDECRSNYSTQVAFIDDGEVIPELPGSLCASWCYGPGGYIVNTTGGLATPDDHLHIALESPVIAWPNADAAGTLLRWTWYRHEDLFEDSPGIFITWGVRSSADADPAAIEVEGWADRNFVYYGNDYFRDRQEVTDLMTPGRLWTQVQFTCYELGYAFGYEGDNGYPAPYFDDVRYICYPFVGPGMSFREIDIANDNFPTIGEVDLVNLGNNSVRFDMANTSSLAGDLVNIPGDTTVVDITIVRENAVFEGDPELRWTMMPNPLFDAYRTSEYGTATSGVSVGVPAVGSSGTPTPGKWAFDLPDENFLFPGDILHYYIYAQDNDGVEIQSATLPATDPGDALPDGYGDFSKPLAYDSAFTVRALPSVYEDPNNPGQLITPATLFWNDFADRGGEEEWHGAFANLGLTLGKAYDTYYTNGPSSGVGNGLGGRATALCLIGYDNMVYTSGDLGAYTISNGDGSAGGDPGADIETVDSWLRYGNRDLFMTGDDLVFDLVINSGSATAQFVTDWMKVNYVDRNLRPLVNNQATPLVKAIVGNGVVGDTDSWIAYGGCLGINAFDAVETNTAEGGVQLAEFTDPNGATGAYDYSAGTLYTDATSGSRVISLPYDLMYIYTPQSGDKANAGLPARAVLLEQVLGYFGVEGDPLDVTPVLPGAQKFAIKNYPNPFNPTTKIEYTMPKAGHLSLKIYNVRGELVKTLIDDQIDTSGHIMWDGTNDSGAKVSSGVYFSEARTNGQVQVNKMALVK